MLDEVNTSGTYAALRFNQLYPPFDDPAVRRAMLAAVIQADFMTAVSGTDAKLFRDGVGCFPVASPLANTAGLSAADRASRDIEGRATRHRCRRKGVAPPCWRCMPRTSAARTP